MKDDVPLIERSLVGDDVAGVQGRQEMLEQVFAARVPSPSFGLRRKPARMSTLGSTAGRPLGASTSSCPKRK
jgi:hypothetical protein